MDQFSPLTHQFYSPTISPNMPISLGLTSGLTLHTVPHLSKQPFIIGICGGTCSGKSQITEKLKFSLDFSATVINEFDFYYPDLNADDNFDSPESINWPVLESCLKSLNAHATFECPKYSILKHKQKSKATKVYPTSVIIVEGLFIFHREEIRNMLDFKIFVDCPDDVRLGNRVKKFTKEMGMSLDFVIDYYLRFTKNAQESFIEPSKVHADVIIPNYGTEHHNSKGTEFLVSHVTQIINGADSGYEHINRLRYAPIRFHK